MITKLTNHIYLRVSKITQKTELLTPPELADIAKQDLMLVSQEDMSTDPESDTRYYSLFVSH